MSSVTQEVKLSKSSDQYIQMQQLLPIKFARENEKYGMSNALKAIIPYATLRMHSVAQLSNEECANAIANHLQSSNKFMQNDPASERFRMETLRAMPQCLTVKRSVKSQLLVTVNQKTKKKSISYWKWLKYNISLKFAKIRMAVQNTLLTMKLWHQTIKTIESHNGSGVGTYFKFLRWLLFVNIISCILSDKDMAEKEETCGNLNKVNATVADHADYSSPETSKALQFVKKPKLIQESSWTKTVSYKHWHSYVKPTDSIGSIFTPGAYPYQARSLTKREVKPARWYPLSADKVLAAPPRILIERHNKEIQRRAAAAEKKRDSLPENIVSLRDLADGTWLRKKSRKARDLKRKELSIHEGRITKKKLDREIVPYVEAEIPKSVDEQLTELTAAIDKEQRRIVTAEDVAKVVYLRDYCISNHHLQPYDYANIDAAKRCIIGKLQEREDFDKIMKDLELEIIDDYKQSLRSAIVDYILMDSDERKRLSIETLPIEFPVLCIRSPVPWHQSKITADHSMRHCLFIGNTILRDIRDLWFSKYRQIRIIRMQDFGTFPVPAAEIEPKLNALCAAVTDVLVKEWLADVAEIFLEKKYAWSQYFEMRPDASTAMIEKYFRSINSLLSKQLRIMITETLKDVRDFFMRYEAGNAFEGDYEELMFLETPFITVKVEPELFTTKLCCRPSILELHSMISRCFDKIIKVGATIPKIETILFPELEQKSYLFPISRFEDTVLSVIGDVLDVIAKHTTGPDNYLKCYENLLYITSGIAEKKLDNFFKLEPVPLLRDFEQQIKAYDTLRKEISMFRCKIPLNMIEIDCSAVNDTMKEILYALRSRICNFFADELRVNNRELCSIFDEIAENISKMPETTQQVVELYNYLCESRDTTMFNLKRRLARSIELILFLFDHQPPSDEDIHLNSRTITWPKEMEIVMELASNRLNMRKDFLETLLRTRRDTFEKKIITMQLAIEQFKRKDPPVLTMEEMEQAVEEIEHISATMAEIRKEAEEINEEEGLLDMELSPYMELPTMSSTVDTFDKLWHTALDFHRNYDRWFYGPFLGLNAEQVREETENTWRILYKLSRVLTEVPGARRVAEMVRGKVEKFRQFIPVLQTICTPGLQARHWERISKIVDVTIIPTDTSSLSEMIEYGLPAHIAKLEEIASAATKEYTLQRNLQKMKEEWQEVYFELTLYRETGVSILTAVDDIQMLLDDHILKAQTMRGSPFVKAFEEEMQQWEEKLIMMQDIIDQWLLCQATWMYLEPIFSSEDILRQMPTESRNFRRIDKIWRNIMLYVLDNKRVIDATAMPNMLQELKLCNSLLEEIQKGLNDYLEKKRLFFPRFFFLSNDELLEILSETKDPQRVQPHLRKCFEGISKLRFTKDEEIIGMLSAEEEYVPLSEELMVISLRDTAEESIIAYFEAMREEWVLSWPGQIIICSSQIHWTNEIEDIVALVRGKLEPGARITLNALIVIDVHARDVYLGNTSRLVITPLTDRCYRTLMGALKLNLGGSPEGPAGTGKTETAKDLAKAVAKQCVVFNCSEGLDYKAMGKFFKGIAQSGAWACFDEFNRIELEVLSVIAQQILSIQMAISMKLDKFVFEGTELKLNPTCNIIITMNPGYAGRQELPDNLKALFRTVAMMVPDYAMIGEITLYSYGFMDAKNLAEKIVHTYKLCSEQLSSQNHYDYGMRAVKTVLIAAGNLKLKYPKRDESILVLRAIVDVNLPKFLSQDVSLFNGIYTDLFPDVHLPQPERDELVDMLKVNLGKRNLQATDWYLEKIVQIYEMILVRHGLMIVGMALGGKTQAYQTLADALGDLSGIRKATMREYRTIYRVINPKAITLDQLYGSFDPLSHEWSDGILANTFREYAQSSLLERKWIVFDGPVDAIWIESMNTVLDDNKKLCLMSGEIIQMSVKMSMLFEPADLEHASPATVSRCGMIYMEPSQLGWRPILESYKKHLKEKLLFEQYELVIELIEWLTEPILRFIQYNCKTFIDTSELHMFLSFTRVFSMMLAEETQVSTVWLQCVLLFSIVWGMCSTLMSESRKIFDVYLRKLLLGNIDEYPKPKVFKLTKQQIFPDRGTVYDWIYDKRNNGCWISWMDTMQQAPLSATAKSSELIIQTTETSIQHFFMKQFMRRSIPLLFVGPTGTGNARTNAPLTQEIVMSKLDRRRKGVYGPAMGKKCVLFVDDLSMPQVEIYGAQPPIELLRQWIDHGYWFDPKDTSILYLVDILLIAAMIPPGGGSNIVTPRFTRHMHVIGIDSFEEATMTKIFSSILDWHFAKGFVVEVSRMGKMMVNATMDVFLAAIKNFLPIPSKSHYKFNLRDFSRVIGGVLLVPAARMKDPDKLIRLWIHELRQPLEKVLVSLLKPGEKMITSSHIRDLFFGNYIEPDADPKIYDEITNLEDLQEKMDYYLAEYNADNGHALLVGMGGSGRNSCARLATSMCEYLIQQIEITKTYETPEWREDLKYLLLRVGCDGKPTVFIFGDHQIKDESFIEDINMILNTADVPNLYAIEEKAEILEKMMTVARDASGGEAFRNRLRMFPSLINCCTIDWFTLWPEDALERVARMSLRDLDIGSELRENRRYYVTPTSFLQLIKSLYRLYGQKIEQITIQQNRYETGLEKLDFAAGQDTVNVEAKKEIVAADEALANEAAAAAQAIKDDCESDLAEATPALEAALAALDTLKPADITIVKAMKSPPAGVRLVMEAVCVLKGVKPERVQDPTGQMIDDYWPASIKLLGDMKFLENLKNFDKDNIPPAFQPEAIKKVSTACEGLCKWVRAMEVYDRVIKVVAPKKAMLAEAEAALAAQMEMLNEKRNLLQEVTQKLQSLNDEFAECMREKKKLEDQIDYCRQKLERAEKLLGGLSGEKSRWSETASKLGASLVEYRNKLINQWHASCVEAAIPCGAKFNLIDILGEPIEIRGWTIHGLPADNFSVENGIIVKHADRWPLMIDPQNQANKWVKNMEKPNKLVVIKLTDPNYVRVMETSIQLGIPVLLENILEEIDAILEPVLLKNVYKQRGILYMRFGETVLEYNPNFRFYITTRLRNPHYLPEIAVKVTLLNFMITLQGLQDQLLGIVVAKELPTLEEKKNQLIVEGANNRKILKEIEDKILEVLTTSEGNILEDETAIKILSTSKVLSEDIEAKQEIAVKTSAEIDKARNGYQPVSKHGAVLFFCISELANIDPMYQYSLPWFLHLYITAIANSEQSDDLDSRMNSLNSYFTASIYRNVCRSLFEKDKVIFSLVLCAGLLRAAHKLDEDLWVFLLTGGVALDNPYPNPDPSWLSDKSWSEVVRASLLPGLEKLRESFQSNISQWKTYYDLSNPQEHPFPPPFEHAAESLRKLVVLRCVRTDKLVAAVQAFVIHHMGASFMEPPPFDLQSSYDDSNNVTPLIFVLSPGSDPMAGLIKFAEDRGISKKNLMTISLGQGQGPIAIGMIERGIKSGEWVILQNCHLAISWMKELDRICDEVIVPENTHRDFRIWLTSYPSKGFPVSILQNGIKMTNEPPKGLKSNLLRSYLNDPVSDPKFFRECTKLVEWRGLLFSLCFFHAVVQERRNFGPLGWNIPYEFNESDLRISILQLQLFLNDYDEVPFDALIYLTGECNYGGRVTDDKDRRLLNSLLKNFYNPEVITKRRYSFSPSGIYHMPEDTDHEGCLQYIRSLPINQMPEVFGVERDTDEVVFALAGEILSKMRPQFDIEAASNKYPVLYMNSMNTVLRQELVKFNELTDVIKETLSNVRKAIRGQVLMSPELEEVYISMSIGKVPRAWDRKSYPSLKPLGSYVNDLLARLQFLQNWIDHDAPNVFWISGFFFTQSFLTAVLQNYARKHKIPIDQLDFEFEITQFESNVDTAPSHGVYITGLFLEGARWNRETRLLDESKLKIMFDLLPVIWLKPGMKIKFDIRDVYHCPVYKTSARRGVLATTGHSSNFILYILIPTDIDESHWINRGVAALCQLDD
ncbi:dynein heavy chain axonemal [Lasius niger]|uniref:Dynein heavy chain axonemal n=1 Tax=Lasius niger TaxID=67767 RepID=A0A0J7KZK5_LASNI|nr:dynein heavy chain axonemal [Lasius niger]